MAARGPNAGRGLHVATTYNVHRWIGRDGRYDPERTLAVLNELHADLIGIQEATVLFDEAGEPAETVQPEPAQAPATTAGFLAQRTGLQVVAGPTLVQGGARYGNLLLTSLPIRTVRRHDLSRPGREPRGLLDVEVALENATLRVLVTHLGLRLGERRVQVRGLMAALQGGRTDNVLLMGDLNQWFPWLGPLAPINRWFGASPVRRSFPAGAPVFPLDRIWLQPRARLRGVRAHRSRLARRASDHLPVKAWIAGG